MGCFGCLKSLTGNPSPLALAHTGVGSGVKWEKSEQNGVQIQVLQLASSVSLDRSLLISLNVSFLIHKWQ